MTNTALNRDPEESVLKPCTLDEISEYIVDATGASVTADSSVRLIHKYCDTLPRDKYVFFPNLSDYSPIHSSLCVVTYCTAITG